MIFDSIKDGGTWGGCHGCRMSVTAAELREFQRQDS
jgi:hypothetical protein